MEHMRLRVKKSTYLATSTRPWRVNALTPIGWVNISGACFATWQDALDWIYGPVQKPVQPFNKHVKEFLATDS